MFNFLPTSESDIKMELKTPISGSPFKCIEDPVSALPRWRTGVRESNEYWLALGPADTFPITPHATLQVDDAGLSITGKIGFSAKAQFALRVWLWFAIVGFITIVGKLIFEIVLDDGMVPYEFNDEVGEVRAVPWLMVFLILHQATFFVFPAMMINQSWNKLNSLVERVRLELLET